MKILYVINRMEQLAGIERILSRKMNYLADNIEYKIMLTTYEQQNKPFSFPISNKIEYVPFEALTAERKNASFATWIINSIRARRIFSQKFTNLLDTVKPDIVIATSYSFSVLDIIINTSSQRGIKTIFESHVQGETVSMSKYIANHMVRQLFVFWDRHIMNSLKRCSCVVTLTNGDVAYWKNYASRIEVIPNILTVEPKPVKDYSVKRVICAGRYAPQKGYDLLLDAWRQLAYHYSDWQLYIFGNGDRSPYQKIVNRLGLGNSVHLMNATQDIVDEFTQSSIYIMSSRFEGFGLVLAEAMACGLPCISFDCPHGPRDIIRNGEDGLLVENGNIQALAQALEHLITDEELRQTMGQHAAQNITRFSPDTIMEQWLELFNKL